MGLRSGARRRLNGLLARFLPGPSAGRLLLYHEIADGGDPSRYVPAPLFRRHLDALGEAGLVGRSVLEAWLRGFPASDAGLTFDDGYASAGEACLEIVARGWSATLFVVPDWVGKRPGILTWRDLTELATVGIEIGAHGFAHESPCGKDVGRITAKLQKAREEIQQRLGREARGLAYPFGLAPAGARAAAIAAGFDYACTTEPGRNVPRLDRFRLRRNEILGTDTSGALIIGKLGGSDDWMRPLRVLENSWRCRSGLGAAR